MLGGAFSDFTEDNVPFRMRMTGALLTDTEPKNMLAVIPAVARNES